MRQQKGRRKRMMCVMAAVAVLGSAIGNPLYAAAAEEETAKEGADIMVKTEGADGQKKTLHYVALGDSIPNGYSADGEEELAGYPELLTAELEASVGRDIELAMETKNGLSTVKLNKVVLQKPEVQEKLRQADMVTLTIGANDLMNQFKRVSREILNNEAHFQNADEALQALQEGIRKNPLLLVKVAAAIAKWDYSSFENQWKQAIETINALRPQESCLVVTTIYNPMEKTKLPGTLNAVVNKLISRMNNIIRKTAESGRYEVVELQKTEIGALTQSDGLHPNRQGQELICSLVKEQINPEELGRVREENLEVPEQIKPENPAREE